MAAASARRQFTFSSGLAAFLPSGSVSGPSPTFSIVYVVSPLRADVLTLNESSSRNCEMVSPFAVIMTSN